MALHEASLSRAPATLLAMTIASLTDLSIPRDGVVRGACPHDCPDTCAMLVTVRDGRAERVAGDPDHPVTQGFLCAKVNRYVERTYHADRVLHPMRRVSPQGAAPQFERVSWDIALGEIAERQPVLCPHRGQIPSLPVWTSATASGSPVSSTCAAERHPAR